MPDFSTPAIMLRSIDHGDYDLIIKFLTLKQGKVTVTAKYAKKSKKRFPGILELFSVLEVVYKTGRGKGLYLLKEASLKEPFMKIRGDIKKTAYASYWTEIINQWLEEGTRQESIYYLFRYVLQSLDSGRIPEEALSILFQIRFMKISGFSPNLSGCSICGIELDNMEGNRVLFDLVKGGIVCTRCASYSSGRLFLSKGTVKQLEWVGSGDIKKAERMRFTLPAIKESLVFLEAFVPYHLGREPKSLTFLRKIR
jgi:DNA repair protein RecO (recombination protein O)